MSPPAWDESVVDDETEEFELDEPGYPPELFESEFPEPEDEKEPDECE